ncbi:hypothetical protein LTR47_006188 [Exophiala xenobiotica]|nr:hypothetical protein LTR47_006188 [Exophiala xenobiotica]KAK5254210.1 hypothetical protein LTS06_001375 [Exophiala xenobiotica]KAK5352434.1 hypothetical protein LTR61_003560 [Exophiala xenobiotica]KAK5361903.1 hypothetical protein LTR11_009665 [Exophiala xenobiotica]
MDLYYRHSLSSGTRRDTHEDEEAEMFNTSPQSERRRAKHVDGFRISVDQTLSPKFGSVFPHASNSREIESVLMDYYVNKIQQDRVYLLLDPGKNPVTFMFEAACTSPTIYSSILMYAADRLARLDSKFSYVMMHYRQRTLNSLRDLLIRQDGSMRDILLVSMMLCTVEINDLYPSTWVVHFSAYRHAIQQRITRNAECRDDDYGYNLGHRYFTHQLIMAKTMFDVEAASSAFVTASNHGSLVDDSRSRWTSTENLALEMDLDSMRIIDPYCNFSNALLLLVNEVTDLKRLQSSTQRLKHVRDRRKQELLIQTKMQRLNASLVNLTQVTPEWIRESEPEVVVTLIEQVAEANRLAALILLLHEPYLPSADHNAAAGVGGGGSPITSIPVSPFNKTAPASCVRDEKENHIKILLQLLDGIVASDYPLAPSWPLWPVFIAGCCTNNEDNRIAVMNIFNTIRGMTHRANIASAFRILRAVWRQRDLQADTNDVCSRTISRRRKREKQACGSQALPSRSGTPSEYIYEWQSVMDMIGERISPT